MEPATRFATEEEQHKRQQELLCRALAESVVNQLVRSGCDTGQLIDFATEVLDNVTHGPRGLAAAGDPDDTGKKPRQQLVRRVAATSGGKPTVHGERVTLRLLHADDFPLLEIWCAEKRLRKTFSVKLLSDLLDMKPVDPADAERRADFMVCDEMGAPIGLVCLFHIDRDTGQAEIAKLLGDSAAEGKGYAAEATRLLLAYAFEKLGLRRVYLRTSGFNLHNINLNEKMGFRFEGILRESARLDEDVVDVVVMSLLASEFADLYELREKPEA